MKDSSLLMKTNTRPKNKVPDIYRTYIISNSLIKLFSKFYKKQTYSYILKKIFMEG